MARQLIAATALSIALIASPVPAAEIDITLFGRSVSITRADDQERLVIDGRELLKNHYVSIEKILIVAGTPVAVGTSSMGGNACEGSPFLVSFPSAGNLRIDGPLDTCSGVGIGEQENSLVLSTSATPDSPGQKWVWTPSDGLKSIAGDKFVANTEKGWLQLRERLASHPSELLDHAEIASQIYQMAGTDRKLLNDILMGVGTGSFKGDFFVGSTCSRHRCLDQEGLIVADVQNKALYLAWKPSGQKIKVVPPVKAWPEKAKSELREWSAKWR